MGVRRPVTMGLIFGFILALWRNHLDARTISAATSRVGNTIARGDVTRRHRRRASNVQRPCRRSHPEEGGPDTRGGQILISSTSTSSDPKPKPKPKPKVLPSADSRVTHSAPTVKAVDLTYPDPFAHPLQPGCEPKTPDPNLPGPRRLDWIADPLAIADEDWPVNCAGHTTLCDILRKTAIDREVLAAVADSHAPGIYEFVDGIKRLGVENFMIIALDDALHARLTNQGVATYRVNTDAQGSHKISAQKFGIIKEFVERGCSVLLTDTDVAWMRDPFPFLYRDADVESMSDGWDNSSAHGFLDTVDDPAMGPDGRRRARAFRVAALNSGMWYVSATEASRRLMGKLISISIYVRMGN